MFLLIVQLVLVWTWLRFFPSLKDGVGACSWPSGSCRALSTQEQAAPSAAPVSAALEILVSLELFCR